MKKREFLKRAGVGTAAAVAAVNAPFVHAQKKTKIK
ncbi:MAG: twin-arginine translocation signal domain-containing protein, partial [Acidiferrobacterales bacterium]